MPFSSSMVATSSPSSIIARICLRARAPCHVMGNVIGDVIGNMIGSAIGNAKGSATGHVPPRQD
eukprot:1287251-Rhodomonas_salina.1